MTELEIQRARFEADQRSFAEAFRSDFGFDLVGPEPDASRRLLAEDWLERQQQLDARQLADFIGVDVAELL